MPPHRGPTRNAQAQELNTQIFECMYFSALETSCDLAKEEGVYETYAGSPVSKGVLQFDMWDVKPSSGRWAQLCRDESGVAPVKRIAISIYIQVYGTCWQFNMWDVKPSSRM